MEIMTRKQAQQAGALKYYTGKPCPAGHIAARFTSRAWCVECANIQSSSEKKKDYDKQYFAANAGRILARSISYYRSNRDAITLRNAEYAAAHPEVVRAAKHTYKLKRRKQELSGITASILRAWIKQQEKLCKWCGKQCENSYHVDHVIPLAKGGGHEIKNLAIACPTCNMRKSAKMPEVFLAEMAVKL